MAQDWPLTVALREAARMSSLAHSQDTSLERELGFATAMAGLAVLASMAAERFLGLNEMSPVFLTAVVMVAARSSLGVAVYASLLCFLSYNFFFMEPRYTLYLSASNGPVTVAMFLASALVCSRLASRLRHQVLLLRNANERTEALQRLARRLVEAGDADAAIHAAVNALRESLDVEVAVLRPQADGTLVEHARGPAATRFDPGLQVAGERACREPMPGNGEEEEDLAWFCLPMRAPGVNLGAVCLRQPAHGMRLAPAQAQLAEAMVRDLAQALARVQLGAQLEATRVQAEGERLRAALLASVSHDLRSPLSTIIGSAESLDIYSDRLSDSDKAQLARDILQEGQRLDRYIQNLLDMTRLEHGVPVLEREWIGADELVGGAARRLVRAHPGQAIELSVPADLPLVQVNAPLLEQALFNALDNAARYSPEGRPVHVEAEADAGELRIRVSDSGPGIPPSERERVFDMFHRISHGDRSSRGTGLGLAICRGILAAHGGSVAVKATDGPGATLEFVLPLAAPPTGPGED
jgi:two-component system sensor histidine kinase KdpD